MGSLCGSPNPRRMFNTPAVRDSRTPAHRAFFQFEVGYRDNKRLNGMSSLLTLIDLLEYCFEKIDFVDQTVDLGSDSPLDLHCNYSRDQILSAVGYYTKDSMPAMREGVKFLPKNKLDIFFITLNKADKQYSPSTMYNDYSINEWLFHWQ